MNSANNRITIAAKICFLLPMWIIKEWKKLRKYWKCYWYCCCFCCCCCCCFCCCNSCWCCSCCCCSNCCCSWVCYCCTRSEINRMQIQSSNQIKHIKKTSKKPVIGSICENFNLCRFSSYSGNINKSMRILGSWEISHLWLI